MKTKRRVSLRSHVMLVFFLIVFAVIGIILISNQVFLKKFYILKNTGKLKSVYTELSAMLQNSETTNEEFKETIVREKTNCNISFALEGESQNDFFYVTKEVVSDYEVEFLRERLVQNLLRPDENENEILEETQDYTIRFVTLPTGNRALECYGYMKDSAGNDRKFILYMPLENIFDAFHISYVFLVYMGAIVLVMGYILVIFLTYRLTEPIYQLTNISKRMKNLDFTARYHGNSGDEIGELGDNMNELASQMERTMLQLNVANEKLQKDLEEKEQVDQMRKDFISNVSHELKTPIALIQGYAEGLKTFAEDGDTDSLNDYCDIIMDEADKMARMVRKLTTLTQIEFGSDGLEMQPFDIMSMIRTLVHGNEKKAAEVGAKIFVDGPDTCRVIGDSFKIEEVLNNYISNGFNHLDGEKIIRVNFADLGTRVRITVQNTGKNIPEDELSKIWIKFYKVDKARTRAYGGSGIGLSIVKAIMEAHHEEYGVYNTDDGVAFWFEIKKCGELVAEDGGTDR